MRLRQILSHPIYGNAYHDRELMDAIETYVCDMRTSREGKLAALRKLDDVMGLEHPRRRDEVRMLNDFIDECKHYNER